MRKENVLSLYDYNYWAHGRVLDVAARLDPAELAAPRTLCMGSILDTFVHTMGAEWIWLSRLKGASPTSLLSATDFPSLDAVRARWRSEEQAMRAFLAGITDDDLQRTVRYSNTKGAPFARQMWQILSHLLNHSTVHRSEVAHVLTELGHSPGDLDMILYFNRYA